MINRPGGIAPSEMFEKFHKTVLLLHHVLSHVTELDKMS